MFVLSCTEVTYCLAENTLWPYSSPLASVTLRERRREEEKERDQRKTERERELS